MLRFSLAGSVAWGIWWALPSSAAQPTPVPLVLEASIPLPDTGGRIDHVAVDLKRGRLFVVELGNGTVDVIDLVGRKVVARIAPAGVLQLGDDADNVRIDSRNGTSSSATAVAACRSSTP